MAGEPPFYAEIDGKWHTMADDAATACGLPVPFGVTWVRDAPAKIHCGLDATEEPAEEPVKAKAKK